MRRGGTTSGGPKERDEARREARAAVWHYMRWFCGIGAALLVPGVSVWITADALGLRLGFSGWLAVAGLCGIGAFFLIFYVTEQWVATPAAEEAYRETRASGGDIESARKAARKGVRASLLRPES